MAIRKVNAITGLGCAEAQEASAGQLSASGIRASAAPESEHDGMRQRNTFGTERRFCARLPPRPSPGGRGQISQVGAS